MIVSCGWPLFTCTSLPCTSRLSVDQKKMVNSQWGYLLKRVFWKRDRWGIVNWRNNINKEKQGKCLKFYSPNLWTFLFLLSHH